MYQIVCRLGLRLRPRWGAYSAPQPPSWILGLTSKGKGKGQEGKEERVRAGRGREGKGLGEGMGRGGGRVGPKLKLAPQNYFPGAGAVEIAQNNDLSGLNFLKY